MTAGKLSRSSGFTLIELLVTLAVLVVLATVAMPSFKSMLSSNQIVADYNQVLAGFHYARSEAVKRRELVSVEVSSVSGEWKLTVEDGAGNVLRDIESSGGKVAVGDLDLTFNSLGRKESCVSSFEGECKVSVGGKLIEVGLPGQITAGE